MPDELLTSWIARTAKANGLKLQTFCDCVFGKERQLWNRDIDRLAPEWLLAETARRTGTSITAVRHTTLDIYHRRLFRERHCAGQLRWILPMGIYHRTRRRFGIQFCPQCLSDDDEPYFRTRWRVAALTFCQKHNLLLHDRCPACGAPVSFHRRELGRPAITDPGLLCLCHSCDFDLRDAEWKPFIPYEKSVSDMLLQLSGYVAGGDSDLNFGHIEVLHQLCKVVASTHHSSNLATFVANAVGAEDQAFRHDGQAFESHSVEWRNHIVQLATWLLGEPEVRIPAAWCAKAVRYNHLAKDFTSPPEWYFSIIAPLNRGW